MLEPLPEERKHEFDSDALVYHSDTKFFYGEAVNSDLIKDIKNKEFQVYAGYYDHPRGCGWKFPKIYLIGRGKTVGKIKVKIQGFYSYCYSLSPTGEYKTYLGQKVMKLMFPGHPSKVKRYRDKKTRMRQPMPFESDILYVRRFLCDTYDYFKPKEAIDPKVAIFDVETMFPVNDEIIAYSINKQTGPIVYNSRSYVDSLYELALDIYDELYDQDVATGWNVEFDVEMVDMMLAKLDRLLNYARDNRNYDKETYITGYKAINDLFGDETETLVNKMIEYNFLKEDNGIVTLGSREFIPELSKLLAIVDLKEISKKMYARQIKGNWSLDNVGKRLCGIAKRHTGAKHIYELDEDTLMEYNVIDSIIPEIIDNYLGGIQGHLILAWSLQVTLEDVMITAVVNDIAIIRAYHRQDIVLPTRDFSVDNSQIKYKAAEPDARPGLYKGLLVLDLKHAYPSAVLSKNISPETKDPKGKYCTPSTPMNPNGVRFNDGKSVFIETLKEIMDERGKVKAVLKTLDKGTTKYAIYKSIDFALKTQAAAFSHGIFGWAHSRMRDFDVADAITAVVREDIESIKKISDIIHKRWVYSHTDSIFIECPKDAKEWVIKYLNEYLVARHKGDPIAPVLESKGFYPIGYIHSKARNVLVPEGVEIDDDDNWDVTGMNFMRSEVPEKLIELEIESIKDLFHGYDVKSRINRLRSRVLELPNVDTTLLGVMKPLSKPINDYGRELKDGTKGGYPGHINALIRAKSEYGFDVSVGEKFMIIPIMTDETTGVKKIRRKKVDIAYSIDDGLPDEFSVDYIHYLRSNLWGKISQLYGMKPKKLEDTVLTDYVKKYLGEETC